jgi:hypothetical protein
LHHGRFACQWHFEIEIFVALRPTNSPNATPASTSKHHVNNNFKVDWIEPLNQGDDRVAKLLARHGNSFDVCGANAADTVH